VGASTAAKWPPSGWSAQYGICSVGSIMRRITGVVLKTARTPEGATQSRPEWAASQRNRAAEAPLRVNQ
jgi:hypothetical protein